MIQAIDYNKRKSELEDWFRWHNEKHPFWKAQREEYLTVTKILNNDLDD